MPSGRRRCGKKKAYVLDDTQVYGAGLAKAWALQANKIGIEVVSPNKTSEGFDAKATDYNALAQKIKASGADIIYIGSITGQNTGKLWKDLRAAMPDVTIMTGDGVFEESWYKGTGAAGNGTYLTFGGVGPDQLTGAGKEWFDKYKTDHAGKQPATYTAYGNASAAVALAALQKAGTNDRWEILRTSWRRRTCRPFLARRRSMRTAMPSVARSAATRSIRRGRRPSSS